jgi:hypothetical protein
MPSLQQDALEEDMIKKIIFKFYDSELREQMIDNYYKYKSNFIAIDRSKVDYVVLLKALKVYCLSLLELSLKYQVETWTNGIFMPYGRGVSVKELFSQLNSD